MNTDYAIVDIEATGGNHRKGRIIDIAIYTIENGKVVELFSSLINPEVKIDYYVSKLTGISDVMVKDAPKFEDVAEEIYTLLQNKLFVAHNVSFDYQFIQKELSRVGFVYQSAKLCTLLLSKILITDVESHSLGKLSASLGIKIKNRHRAAGDAEATAHLLDYMASLPNYHEHAQLLVDGDQFKSILAKTVKIDVKILDTLPDEPGVFYFRNQQKKVLFVGRGESVKNTAIRQLNSKRNKRIERFGNQVHSVDYKLTGNALIAELLFYQEVFKYNPLINSQPKQLLYRYCISASKKTERPLLFIARTKDKPPKPLYYFKDYKSAEKVLCDCVKTYELPSHMFSLYLNKKKQLSRVLNADDPTPVQRKNYNNAIKSLKSELFNHLIVADGRNFNEVGIVIIKEGKFIGYSYFPNNVEIDVEKVILTAEQLDVHDPERVIRRFVDTSKSLRIDSF